MLNFIETFLVALKYSIGTGFMIFCFVGPGLVAATFSPWYLFAYFVSIPLGLATIVMMLDD